MANDFTVTKEELAEENRVKANREVIINSLKELKYQTSRHICQNTGLSIDDVLRHIETDEEIRYQLVGGLTVYYLSQNTPKGRLFNTGNNCFEEVVEANEETKQVKRKIKPRVDLVLLEQCAAEGLTITESASRLGTSLLSLSSYLHGKQSSPMYREAWDRGLARQQKSQSNTANDVRKNLEFDPVASGDYVGETKPEDPKFNRAIGSNLSNIHNEVLEAIRLGYASVTGICYKTGIESQTVENCLVNLVKNGEVVRNPKWVNGKQLNTYFLSKEDPIENNTVSSPDYCTICEEPFKGIAVPIVHEGLVYCSSACVDFSKFGAKVKSNAEVVAAPEVTATKYPFEKNVTETMNIPIAGGLVTIKLENVKFANGNDAEQSFLMRLQRTVDELAEEVAR